MNNQKQYPLKPYLLLLAIPLFIVAFLGAGLYLSAQGVSNAFYQISPAVAIIPALIWALLFASGPFATRLQQVLTGMGNQTLLAMCMIYIFAGAFGVVTLAVGCIDDLINFIMSLLPAQALLPSLFILSASIGFAMGSSMGVVAAVTPIGIGLANATGTDIPLVLGIVIGGAMFGDNLSMISDTTLAATQTQKAKVRQKFILNAPIAFVAAVLYLIMLSTFQPTTAPVPSIDYHAIKLIPYLAVIVFALAGMNVFLVLGLGTLVAGIIGIVEPSDYTLIQFTQDIYRGFASMNEIMVLSLLLGGLVGLIQSQGGFMPILNSLNKINAEKKHTRTYIALSIALVISIVTAAVANNVISILIIGTIVEKMAKKSGISQARSATLLSIFSCAVQGLLPHGAQVLLASRLSQVSPLDVISHVGYCYILAGVGLIHILIHSRTKD